MRAADSAVVAAPAKPDEKKKEPVAAPVETREVELIRSVAINKLRFSPYAWAKYHWLLKRTSNEVAAFAISSRQDITYIDDIRLLKQEVSGAYAEFDQDDMSRYLDDMVDEGYQPLECMRIWLHTHPGNSASPSSTDEKTFEDAFGQADWAVMCILAKGGDIKAKACLTAANGQFYHSFPIPVSVDCTGEFNGVSKEDAERWEEEFVKYVNTRSYTVSASAVNHNGPSRGAYPPYPSWQGNHHFGQHNDQGGYGGSRFDDDNGDIDWDEVERWRMKLSPHDDDDLFGADSEKNVDSIDEADFDLTEEFDYPEYIVEVKQSKNFTYVMLEERWFAYPISTALELRQGEALRCARDLCEDAPFAYGELTWDYGEGVAEATTLSDLNQTITVFTSMSFDDINDTLEGWLEEDGAQMGAKGQTVQDQIDAADEAAERLAELAHQEETPEAPTVDPSAETVHGEQPVCEGQPDARDIQGP